LLSNRQISRISTPPVVASDLKTDPAGMKFEIINGKLLEINVEDVSDHEVNDPTWRGLRLISLLNGGANFEGPFLTSGTPAKHG